jgi:hypothetical protein
MVSRNGFINNSTRHIPSRTISVIFTRIFTAEQCQHSNYLKLGYSAHSYKTRSERVRLRRVSEIRDTQFRRSKTRTLNDLNDELQ